MDSDERLNRLQARTQQLGADLRVLASEIHSQLTENERHCIKVDEDDQEAG